MYVKGWPQESISQGRAYTAHAQCLTTYLGVGLPLSATCLDTGLCFPKEDWVGGGSWDRGRVEGAEDLWLAD